MSTRADKKAALTELLRLGHLMSNVCFNLSQHTAADIAREEETRGRWTNTRESLADLQRRWDKAILVFREVSRPARRPARPLQP